MLSVKNLAEKIDGDIVGDSTFVIEGVCDLENGKLNHLTYIKDSSYEKYLECTKASVIIIDESMNVQNNNKILIKVSNPGNAFIKILKDFKYISNPENIIDSYKKSVSKFSFGSNVIISKNVYIGENVKLGDNTTVYPGCYIGDNSKIGDNVTLFSNVSVYDNIKIGNGCKIDSGTVIGTDGFGIIKNNNLNYSIPHIGSVIIGDDVHIGSNCSIDRGTILDTIIGDNCRLDNLVQIAHNVKIGNGCIIAGQSGIAGSTVIGDNVTIAGRAGIIDHLLIGDNSVITAHSLVCKSLNPNSFVSGNPATDHKKRLKRLAAMKKIVK